MLTVDILTRGLDLSALPDLTEEAKKTLISKLAEFLQKDMQASAPFRTGVLRGSIVKEVSGEEAVVGPTAPYAVHVEFGTRPRMIFPVNARALRFTLGFGTVRFAAHVRHPGTKPTKFVEASKQATLLELPSFWREAWQEGTGG